MLIQSHARIGARFDLCVNTLRSCHTFSHQCSSLRIYFAICCVVTHVNLFMNIPRPTMRIAAFCDLASQTEHSTSVASVKEPGRADREPWPDACSAPLVLRSSRPGTFLMAAPSLDEVKTCVAFIQRGLFQPEGPASGSDSRRIQLCTMCTGVCGDVLIRAHMIAPEEFPKRLFLRNCRVFLVDAMCVLTTLSTVDDDQKIWPDLRRACNMCHEPSHKFHYLSDEDLLTHLLVNLAVTVIIGLRIAGRKFSLTTTPRFATDGSWPASIRDIIPGDCTRSALANLLCCWSRQREGPMHLLLVLLAEMACIWKVAKCSYLPTSKFSSHLRVNYKPYPTVAHRSIRHRAF